MIWSVFRSFIIVLAAIVVGRAARAVEPADGPGSLVVPAGLSSGCVR